MGLLNCDEKRKLEAILSNLGTSSNKINQILDDVVKRHKGNYLISFLEESNEIFISLISDKSVEHSKTMRDEADKILRLNIPREAYNKLIMMYATEDDIE